MKIELHCHTARYSACAVNTPHEMMRALGAEGYDAVYITEHDNVWTDEELADLRAEFPYLGIYPGMELTLGESSSQHLLVLGSNDAEYLILPSAAEVLEKARRHGHLTVLAHPYRWAGSADLLQGHDQGRGPTQNLPDAIEHLTCNQEDEASREASLMAGRLGLPVVNAGDSHSIDMVGRYWIETYRPLIRAEDIRRIVIEGAYRNCQK